MQTPQGLDAQHGGELFPIDESRRLRANPASRNSGEAGADRTGLEILAMASGRPPRIRKQLTRNKAAPQGLDAQHGGELFPIDESRRLRANPASRNSGEAGADRTGVEILAAPVL